MSTSGELFAAFRAELRQELKSKTDMQDREIEELKGQLLESDEKLIELKGKVEESDKGPLRLRRGQLYLKRL